MQQKIRVLVNRIAPGRYNLMYHPKAFINQEKTSCTTDSF